MLACDEVLTLVRHIREQDGDRYECIPVPGASWYRKTTIAVSADGAKPVGTCICRIPEGVIAVPPSVGDFVVRGSLKQVERAPRDLAGTEYMQVTSVGDNRRGRLKHWRVEGA